MTMVPGESLCFFSALMRCRDGAHGINAMITRLEWLWHNVQHMRGVRHDLDASPTSDPQIVWDPVGHSIREIALFKAYTPLDEIEAERYAQLLFDADCGNLEAVTRSFDGVKNLRKPLLDPAKPVACVAAQAGHMPILKYAMARGAVMDYDLCYSVIWGSAVSEEVERYYHENKEAVDEKAYRKRDPAKTFSPPDSGVNWAWLNKDLDSFW